MKAYIIPIFIAVIFIPIFYVYLYWENTEYRKTTNISNLLSTQEFEEIKDFIIQHGNTRTFRNYDSNNPYYAFKNVDAYLGAEIWQKNSFNDPLISDFNSITIQRTEKPYIHYEIIIVRDGDIKNKDIHTPHWVKENWIYVFQSKKVFLPNEKNFIQVIADILKEINITNDTVQ